MKCLNEAVACITAVTVWKCRQSMDSLGQCLFKDRMNTRSTRSATSDMIRLPVPGYPMLATNIMARIWNNIPELHSASTLTAAKRISHNWAKKIPR